METLKLTAQEAMKRLGFNKSKVYYWINSGKFNTVDSPKGKLILITQAEIEEIKNLENPERFETDYVEYEKIENSFKPVAESSKNSTADVMMEALKTVQGMFEYISNQQKLLTDSEKMTQLNYFELKAKFETLQESYKILQADYEKLQKEHALILDENKKTAQKTFFGLKIGKYKRL